VAHLSVSFWLLEFWVKFAPTREAVSSALAAIWDTNWSGNAATG
jgi:hypothetical protein